MPKGFTFYRRQFLNPPGTESVGAVLASLDDDGTADFILSDCFRQVSLALPTASAPNRKRSARKLRLIAQTALDLAEAIETQETER